MTPEDQQTLQELKHLKLEIYKGLHLNADRIDTNIIDQWIEQKQQSLTELEKVINHIHMYDFFQNIQDEDKLRILADEIVRDWKNVLSSYNPKYRVVKYEDYGPEITFYLDRRTSNVD